MGWKGAVRSIAAANRADQREAKRRQRELERQDRQYQKMQELEQAAYEVEVYENHIDLLLSVHTECSAVTDWNKVASASAPLEPSNKKELERKATKALSNYQPGSISRLFGQDKRQKKKLDEELDNAIKDDESNFNREHKKWEQEYSDWAEARELAGQILAGHVEAKVKAIKELNTFNDISGLGSSINFRIKDTGFVQAEIDVHGNDVIPHERKSLLKSGRLSVKQMPNGQFNELYQDYVCSCVLRVANELFSMLPEEKVIVTAVDKLLNTKTGHMEKTPILSACVSRNTLSSLNLQSIDPSDSMSNFVHTMSFKKTKGFDGVDRITPDQIPG